MASKYKIFRRNTRMPKKANTVSRSNIQCTLESSGSVILTSEFVMRYCLANRTWMANHSAKLAMTPTTAALIASMHH